MSTSWDKLQQTALSQVLQATTKHKEVCATAPTGFGKTRLSQMLIKEYEQRGAKWVFYTHRKLLFAQTHKAFNKDGIYHGCRAAGYESELALLKSGQLAMIQSERASVKGHKKRGYHKADFVMWDEAHCCKSGFAEELFRHHQSEGATQVGLTATPVNLGHMYKKLVTMASNSDLRSVGGIVLCKTFSPDEVDMSDVKRMSSGEFNQKAMGKKYMIQQVVDSVIHRWLQYNPHHKPTLLFAPGVKESMWFVDQFNMRGIAAAHIDGLDIYLGQKDKGGEPVIYRSSQDKREEVAKLSENGVIKVVCNRFVMREGVDWPWLAHGIWACTLGSEEGWVQSGGRILRSYPGLKEVVIQDHGGNWWRHGSLNADRSWDIKDTMKSREQELKKQRQDGEVEQDLNCPGCRQVVKRKLWQVANCCPYCGHKFKSSVRKVYQTSGKLVEMRGDVVKKRPVYSEPQKAWNSLYYPSKNSKRPVSSTFKQLVARFRKNFPRYDVSVTGGKTMVVDRYNNCVQPLSNVPPPSSPYWAREVRTVPPVELQRP